jgi:hypothetical protein
MCLVHLVDAAVPAARSPSYLNADGNHRDCAAEEKIMTGNLDIVRPTASWCHPCRFIR